MAIVSIRDIDDRGEVYAIIEAKDVSCYAIEQAIYEAKERARIECGADSWCVEDILDRINLPCEWKMTVPYFGELSVYV